MLSKQTNQQNYRLKVFFTIDTEVWWFYDDLEKNFRSSIYGETPQGTYGLTYQLEIFKHFNLKANYFVEPLFTLRYGIEPLEKIISLINGSSQDVQAHIHTEWLSRSENRLLISGATGNNIKDFNKSEQCVLIGKAKHLLETCGARNVVAFRAGNYGGNLETLDVLSENGIRFDTTYNYCYLQRECDMTLSEILLQPQEIQNVFEYPITFFSDYPGHYRHLQVTACSSREIKQILKQAWENKWDSIVIVLHSFEWIRRVNNAKKRKHKLDKIVRDRFLDLCQILSTNEDKFVTKKFSELDSAIVNEIRPEKPLSSTVFSTLERYGEQLYRRFF